MTKVKRLVSILMAVVMLVGSMSVAASAAHTDYLDDAIITQYNSIDKVDLTPEQKSSLIMDMLDIMLDKEQIFIDIPILGDINLCSTDEALDSIYSITGNILYGRLTVGDLVILETHRDLIGSVRRTTEGKTDIDVINSLVDYVAAIIPTLTGMLDNTMSWGMVKGFLPPEFRIIIDDFSGYIKELLWDLLHPVNEEVYPSTTTLDSLVEFIYANQLAGERAAIVGFDGVLPGFAAILATDNGYRTVDEALFAAANEYLLPVLNGDLKEVIADAVNSNANDGGELNTLVNVDYTISAYTFTDDPLSEQFNTVVGTVVSQMLKEGQEHFTWDFEADADQSQADLFASNVQALLSKIIVLGGEENFNPEGKSLVAIGDYIARVAVEQFVKHMDIPDDATMQEIAYLGLRELCASIIPENSYAEVPGTGSEDDYRNAIIEIGADIGTFYLNNNIGLECAMSTTADEFLSAFVAWCLPYINGLFDDAVLSDATTGWGKVDAILWEFIPKNWLPYEAMFNNGAGTEADVTLYNIVDYFLDAVFSFDINAIYTFFEQNTKEATETAYSELYTLTARQTVINLIRDILDGAFYTEDADGNKVPCVPAEAVIDEFEDILSEISILKSIVSNIFAAISTRKDTLVTTTINLLTMLMGAADPQSLGDVELAIDSQIYCEGGTVPADQYLRISNYSEGVNRGWREDGITLYQDKMYEIEIDSVTNDSNLVLASVPTGTTIAANSYYDVAVSGTIDATKEVMFQVGYYILDEYGSRINETVLIKTIYANFSIDEYGCGGTSAAIDETNRVSFEAFDTHLHTTNAYDISLFSILATNNGVILGNAVRDIRRAVLKSGTLPTGITMNDPASGPIVRIDEASFTTDSYGTVNPYSAETMDPDAEQPYGEYDVTIAFEICSEGADSGTETEERAHQLVIYNDFGLPGLLGDIMDANRQPANYPNANVEWTAYLNAVKAGFALLHGNADHSKMFADETNPDGSANDYAEAVDAINTAVAALDAKVKPTNETLLADLQAAVAAQAGVEREDYILFTYDRWDEWYDHANGLINSQIAPEGATDFVAPAISDFDLLYAKHMVNLMYGRLTKKAYVKTHLIEAIEDYGNKTSLGYTAASWAPYEAALENAIAVNGNSDGALLQTTINSARVELMKAHRRLVVSPTYLTAVAGTTTVIDNGHAIVYGLTQGLTNSTITNWVVEASGYDVAYTPSSGTAMGTGSIITVKLENTETVVTTYNVIIYGDVDGDGFVKADVDAMLISAYLEDPDTISVGSPEFIAADVNRDNVINEADMEIIASGSVNQVNPNS